ncbi:short-chain dehydrogenase/reductase SDR [Rubrobacter xylanophilus DSM 9941]|mgnify:CR=1 FL=1|uniref:Short-chain dehydrogenase/reductase SDR n=1 Tax=Rubrobacter xylanophilus (strain DSM 9941 / JCM 11954 / NBRC 16129 / PRD-1) TaxID=266117 RepID=Q1AYP1_RUBXD|nr:SDR family oxidoreductase [Rubrobacter xylanophilus]ABG03487.1 short-chain dehydrogenase/reductase SDR [Rubrobacter xylanophilus DSM 9941]
MSEGEGRVALVSGGNRGIGLEICRQLAAKGIAVVLGSRDERRGREAAEGIAGRVVAHQLDVADQESVDRIAAYVEREFGRLDILVNNAGVAPDGGQRGVEADLEKVREALEINLLGAWRLSRAFIPLMRRNGYGRIVNVSSGLGSISEMGGGSPAYRVSKAALNALTRILASELRGTGVLVNAVCPGWVQTEMGSPGAPRPVQEGADTPVWAATLPKGGPTGGFFRDRRPIPW